MATTYLYSVSPKKPIRFLCGVAVVPPIRTPRSIQMTLEQVKDCLKYGSVYRRFAEEGINERVTTVNVERLHNAHYIPEEEFNSLSSGEVTTEKEDKVPSEQNKRGQVEISEDIKSALDIAEEIESEVETKDEIIEEVEEEIKSDDEIVEVETTEEVVEEEISDEETEDDIQDELVEEDEIAEETSIEEEASDTTESYSNKNSYNYNNKNRNKKNRH